MTDMSDMLELPDCPYLSLGLGVTHVASQLANIKDGQVIQLNARDRDNFCFIQRFGDTILIEIDGKILGLMKDFVAQFYTRFQMVDSSTTGSRGQTVFNLEQWEHIWANHPASLVFIDVS